MSARLQLEENYTSLQTLVRACVYACVLFKNFYNNQSKNIQEATNQKKEKKI